MTQIKTRVSWSAGPHAPVYCLWRHCQRSKVRAVLNGLNCSRSEADLRSTCPLIATLKFSSSARQEDRTTTGPESETEFTD